MSLSLTCACGARFEVEETFAGHDVACPECRSSLRAPLLQPTVRRTSGLALAGVILALAGTFTVIGTALAVLLGLAALVSIGRSRQRLAGTGYAIFAIVWGCLFSGLALFAYSRSELFGVDAWLRQSMLAGQVRFDGPLEIVREDDGFAIHRPNEKWGVSQSSPDAFFWPDDPDRLACFILVNIQRNALVDVTWIPADNQGLEQLQDRVLNWFGGVRPGGQPGNRDRLLGFSQCRLRHSGRVHQPGDAVAAELLLDVRFSGEPRTYLVRIVPHGQEAYIVRGWAPRRRFAAVETEIRKALDSFRVLN